MLAALKARIDEMLAQVSGKLGLDAQTSHNVSYRWVHPDEER